MAAKFFNSKGFPNTEFSKVSNTFAIIESCVAQNPTLTLKLVDHAIDTIKLFSSEHRRFMKLFIADMSNLQDEKEGYRIIDSFNKEIINSNLLNEGEKIQLVLFGSQSHALLKFYNDDSNSGIYQSIVKQVDVKEGSDAAANARVSSSCKVNWKSVWGGAVVGGVVSGISGALVGGAGGTVALPSVGTVTGAVAGGVFGFAKGFVGGAATGVATELLLSCFNSTMSQEVYCRQYWERWQRGEITVDRIPTECWPDIDFTDFTMNPL